MQFPERSQCCSLRARASVLCVEYVSEYVCESVSVSEVAVLQPACACVHLSVRACVRARAFVSWLSV